MKSIFKLAIAILLIIKSSNIYSQLNKNDLIGVWQFGSPEITSSYLETYQFFNDGSFKFNTNQYDGLRRIISIGGNFELQNTHLVLKIKYVVELEKGKITKDEMSTKNNSWIIEGGETKIKKLINSKNEIIEIEKNYTSSSDYLLFDGQIFYRIYSNPNSW